MNLSTETDFDFDSSVLKSEQADDELKRHVTVRDNFQYCASVFIRNYNFWTRTVFRNALLVETLLWIKAFNIQINNNNRF